MAKYNTMKHHKYAVIFEQGVVPRAFKKLLEHLEVEHWVDKDAFKPKTAYIIKCDRYKWKTIKDELDGKVYEDVGFMYTPL